MDFDVDAISAKPLSVQLKGKLYEVPPMPLLEYITSDKVLEQYQNMVLVGRDSKGKKATLKQQADATKNMVVKYSKDVIPKGVLDKLTVRQIERLLERLIEFQGSSADGDAGKNGVGGAGA